MPIDWDNQEEVEKLVEVIVQTVMTVSGAIWGKVPEGEGNEYVAEAVRVHFANIGRDAVPTAGDTTSSKASKATKSKTKTTSTAKPKDNATKDKGATASRKRKAPTIIVIADDDSDNPKKTAKLDKNKGKEATKDDVVEDDIVEAKEGGDGDIVEA